jgi:penicillin-binding protein 1A
MSTSPSSTGTTKSRISKLLKTERTWFRKVIKYTWIVFFVFLVGMPLYVLTVSIDLFGLYGGMPDIKEIENPENDLSSHLISADGEILGSYYRYNSNRSQVMFDELSDDLVHTLLYSEDHRFYNHSGLDFESFLRVGFGLVTFNPQGGGSTITQQLAKNLFTRNPDRSLDGKLAKLGGYVRRFIEKTKEWIISVDLERNFTKEEIMVMYLNTVQFNNAASGIKVAAQTYFGTTPDSLNIPQSAVLVGMLQNPSMYNPHKWPERALGKRNTVLNKLYEHKYKITSLEQLDSMKALPLGLDFKVRDHNEGLATYFRSVIGTQLLYYLRSKGIDLYNSGLRIYTTIDTRLQKHAEEAMSEHMAALQKEFDAQWKARGRNPWSDENGNEYKNFLRARIKKTDPYKELVAKYGEKSDSVHIILAEKRPMTVFDWRGDRDTTMSYMDSLNYYMRFLQSGMMSMDPNTGEIKAWVGGINYKYFKFDHVRQSKRQPGSTFKPFVYGLAMESGYSPCYEMSDISPVFKVPGGTWSPPNSDGKLGSGEKMNLRQAMGRSINTITAQVMQRLGPENVVEFAHRLGVESKLDAVPSLCLGVSDVSLFELVGAYSTYANNGIYTKPFFITRIEDKNGNVMETFIPETRQAVNEQTAYKMIYMLRGGVEEAQGTSGGLPRELKEDNEIGGKTGTTNDASDGWYMGLTHNLVTGVWVGGDERAIRFPSWNFGQGIKTARPIWAKYMTKVYADQKSGIIKGQFKRPISGVDMNLECGKELDSDSVQIQIDQRPIDINN